MGKSKIPFSIHCVLCYPPYGSLLRTCGALNIAISMFTNQRRQVANNTICVSIILPFPTILEMGDAEQIGKSFLSSYVFELEMLIFEFHR